jgi:hypothetical protein
VVLESPQTAGWRKMTGHCHQSLQNPVVQGMDFRGSTAICRHLKEGPPVKDVHQSQRPGWGRRWLTELATLSLSHLLQSVKTRIEHAGKLSSGKGSLIDPVLSKDCLSLLTHRPSWRSQLH